MTVSELLKALEKGPLRKEFKEIVQGAGLDALREPIEDVVDKGAWRGLVKEIVREVLDEREAG